MAKTQPAEEEASAPKPLVWLRGEIKTPPFTVEGRQKAGILLRLMQRGEAHEKNRCRSRATEIVQAR